MFSLASFWRVDFRKQPGRIEDFLSRLRDIREVAEAYHDSAVAAPVVAPGNDPLFRDQKYLTAAPVGIDAQFAWLHPGGDGTGVSVVDLEMDWNFTHEDLAPRSPMLLWGDQEGSDANKNHGTEALGVMVAADNDLGGIGIAPRPARCTRCRTSSPARAACRARPATSPTLCCRRPLR